MATNSAYYLSSKNGVDEVIPLKEKIGNGFITGFGPVSETYPVP